MSYSIYQSWDPLRVCIVGRSYPPEFYSWIKSPHVRNLFEQIATETEEDYQNIINKLQEFGVQVLRPDLSNNTFDGGKYASPPMTPRDYTIMIGDKFYTNYDSYNFGHFYYNLKLKTKWHWWCRDMNDLATLPADVQAEIISAHDKYLKSIPNAFCFEKIFEHIRNQGNTIKSYFNPNCSGGYVIRLGKDLYFGTETLDQDQAQLKQQMDQEFPEYRTHIINTGGHIDGTFSAVCPGLILSATDAPSFNQTFPGWEIVTCSTSISRHAQEFNDLKKKNKGKWWIPGFEHDQEVIDFVETRLTNWTGYVEETVFDVNVLIIDQKNVITTAYNKEIFDAFDRYGITPHVIPFRHRYFWDGGIHCNTSDLHREGTMQDYFIGQS